MEFKTNKQMSIEIVDILQEVKRRKGTRTYYIKGTIGNKKVCYTLARTNYNQRFGFWSWVQTKYKNGKTKRTLFAKSGSKANAEKRAERLFNRLTEKNGFIRSPPISEKLSTNDITLSKSEVLE